MTQTTEPKTIDMTPTWRGLLPLLLSVITHGTEENQRTVRAELVRMAEAADQWNAHCNAKKDKDAGA